MTNGNEWEIDDSGRIFYRSQFVALIERESLRDGASTKAFRVKGVRVRGDGESFNTSIVFTPDRPAHLTMPVEQWSSINRGRAMTRQT